MDKKIPDKKILDKIYGAVGDDFLNRVRTETAVDTEIEPLLESLLKSGIPLSEHGKAEAAVWSAVSLAEREGFRAGARFLLRLLLECLS